MTLRSLRGSALALILACAAWSAGCATPKPMVDPYFASGAYTPARVAVMPPDVFVVLDQFGDNDDVKSAALGEAVSNETVRLVEQSLRARGYDVDLSTRWDGIVAQDGSTLVSRDELGWLANGVLQFGNGPDGGAHGTMTAPQYVAPELAAKVGWATQSDALLYVNVKGVTTTNGKRTASILAAVFIVVIVAAIVLAIVAGSKGNSGGSTHAAQTPGGGGLRATPRASPTPAAGGLRGAPSAAAMPSGHAGGAAAMPSGHAGGASAMPSGNAGGAAAMPSGNAGGASRTLVSPTAGGLRATPGGGVPSGGGLRATPGGGGAAAPVAGGWRGAPTGGVGAGGGGWRGGTAAGRPVGAPVYGGGPHVGVGVAVWVPLDGPVYTHDGNVQHEDEWFAGDELYVSMTLVSTYDGRVLWHARENLDLDADDNRDIDRMVQSFLNGLPARGGAPAPAPAAKH